VQLDWNIFLEKDKEKDEIVSLTDLVCGPSDPF
jgi:hypothetical protein